MRSMKRLGSAVLLTMLFGGIAAAQDAASTREADHAALRALMAHVTDAANKQDVDTLVTYFTPDFVFTSVDQTVLTNAASIRDFYKLMVSEESSPVKSLTLHPTADVLTRFLDDNTGYCYGSSADEYTLRRNGRTITMTSRWTAIVVKHDGQWKVAAVHTGVNFLDNPVLEAKSMSAWRKLRLGLGFGKYPGEQ